MQSAAENRFIYTICEEVSGRLCANEAVGAFVMTAGKFVS
jgi:hypothetical protein